MTRIACLTVAALVAIGGAVAAQGQSTAKSRTAIGPVKEVANGFVTIDSNKTAMRFAIDANTHVLAEGAGAKTRAKKAAGEGGLTIADAVHEGDQVKVTYVEAKGGFLATTLEVMKRRPLNALPVK